MSLGCAVPVTSCEPHPVGVRRLARAPAVHRSRSMICSVKAPSGSLRERSMSFLRKRSSSVRTKRIIRLRSWPAAHYHRSFMMYPSYQLIQACQAILRVCHPSISPCLYLSTDLASAGHHGGMPSARLYETAPGGPIYPPPLNPVRSQIAMGTSPSGSHRSLSRGRQGEEDDETFTMPEGGWTWNAGRS